MKSDLQTMIEEMERRKRAELRWHVIALVCLVVLVTAYLIL